MLNLVASGMLLRPIHMRPAATSPPPSSSLCTGLRGTEKEPLQNGLNTTAPMSNGISKADSSPSFHTDTLIIENPSLGQKTLQTELTSLVQNGVNGPDTGPVKVYPESNGKTVVDSLLHGKTPPKKAKVLDFSLLKNPFFCIYTWSLVFSQLAYFIPYFHLSARARTLGIDPMDASFIISVAGEYPFCKQSICKTVVHYV